MTMRGGMWRWICVCALMGVAQAANVWHVPARGSAERAQILDALRADMRSRDAQMPAMVFQVNALCVDGYRGWLSATPRSADGQNSYEEMNVVLGRRNQRWEIVDIACGEEDCPAGTSAEEMRAALKPRCR